ncbi:unnamed protein product, partial [Owenia fusiformis]
FISTTVAYVYNEKSREPDLPDIVVPEPALPVPASRGLWQPGSKLASADDGTIDEKDSDLNDDTIAAKHDGTVKSGTAEAGTLTDVCNSGDLPEVEIVSLVEEQIPKYKLRADTLTEFGGYNNEDWIQTPVLQQDIDLDLTHDQIDATLQYFILCADRMSQMTKAFHDIEAVTRLLEEKERDLELAARIGQNLLAENKSFTIKNEHLEEQIAIATDLVNQLKHEVCMKDDLLRIYTDDGDDSTRSSPSRERVPFGLGHVNFDHLHNKVKELEDENLTLRVESANLKTDCVDFEAQEKRLVNDVCKQLSEANEQVRELEIEMGQKTDVNIKQQEEITSLLGRIVDLEAKVKKVSVENGELHSHVQASQEAQKSLTNELADLKDKYNEALGLLVEANDELKTLRRKRQPHATRHHFSTFSPYIPADSLACELESEFKKDLEYPEGYSPNERKQHSWKVLETAKFAKKAVVRRATSSRGSLSTCSSLNSSLHLHGGHDTSNDSMSNRSSCYMSDGESLFSEGYHGDTDSLYGSSPSLGRPGVPGSKDLTEALTKLRLQSGGDTCSETDTCDTDTYVTDACETESNYSERLEGTDGTTTPTPCRTPESMMSTGSGLSGLSAGYAYKIPEKLQIVKPLEGSATLHQWQRLATPNLGGLLEERPGVQVKGERKIEFDEEMYALTDYEEDDATPGKGFERASSTFTYTTSRVMHPTEYNPEAETNVTPSASACRPSTIPMVTHFQHDQKATATYSINKNLSQVLRERDTSTPDPEIKESPFLSPILSPSRFSSIVTETMYDSNERKVGVTVYTSPTTDTTATSSTVGAGILSFAGLSLPRPDISHFHIIDRIKENIGLSSIFASGDTRGAPKGSAISTLSTKPKFKPPPLTLSSSGSKMSSGFSLKMEPATPPPSPTTPSSPKTPPSTPTSSSPMPMYDTPNALMQIAGMQMPSRSPSNTILGAIAAINRSGLSQSRP